MTGLSIQIYKCQYQYVAGIHWILLCIITDLFLSIRQKGQSIAIDY